MDGPPAAITRDSYDVFISYKEEDVALAEELNKQLLKADFSVWFDKARLKPGFNWHLEIEAGCNVSRVFLPVLTPRWKTSLWTKFETYGADLVIPLYRESEFHDVFTAPLLRFQGLTIDLMDANPADWNKLFESIRGLLAKPAAERNERPVHLPVSANPNFVGREAQLNQIHETLHQSPTTALTQGGVQALAAMGGVGKTALARQYVEKFWRLYPQIYWVNARLNLETEFARLADILGLDLKNAKDSEKARAALGILNERDEWLLVIDNAEDEKSVKDWLPRAGGCRTIVTSRYKGWSAAVPKCDVDVLEPEPARELLLRRAGRDADPVPEAEADADAEINACNKLAKLLGYLPLALEQAAAYVGQQGTEFSFADYLRLYEESHAELLAAGVLGSTDYPDSVMTTWRQTIEKLSARARVILRLSAFLAPDRIPHELFEKNADRVRDWASAFAAGGADGDVGSPDQSDDGSASDEFMIRSLVGELARHSIITPHGHEFSLHALVQTIERLGEGESSAKDWAERALNSIETVVSGANPSDISGWPVWDRYADRGETAARYADTEGIGPQSAAMMGIVGSYYEAKALRGRAEPLMRRALEIDEKAYGPDHPRVAIDLNNLALLLMATKRTAEAEPLMRRVLEIDENAHGPDHPEVAIDLNNLAQLLRATNRMRKAEPLMWRVLKIDEKSFGPDHPTVAIDLGNLAQLLRATYRTAEAEPMMRRALEIDKKAYGPNHPNIAIRLNNLAGLLLATNRMSEAEPLTARAFDIFGDTLGADHPNTRIIGKNLRILRKEIRESVGGSG